MDQKKRFGIQFGRMAAPEESPMNQGDIAEPVEYFCRYVTPNLIDQLVEKTNICAIHQLL
jgi:hypothetical protein